MSQRPKMHKAQPYQDLWVLQHNNTLRNLIKSVVHKHASNSAVMYDFTIQLCFVEGGPPSVYYFTNKSPASEGFIEGQASIILLRNQIDSQLSHETNTTCVKNLLSSHFVFPPNNRKVLIVASIKDSS